MKLSLRRSPPEETRASRGWGRLLVHLACALAWARESLLARAAGIAVALAFLSIVGRSAVAGNVAAPAQVEALVAPLAPPSGPPDPTTSSTAGAPGSTRHVGDETPSPPPADAPREASRGRATPDDPVFLNVAAEQDLRRLPGIGAKRAQAILTLRARLGRFRQVEDLLKVKGIGRAMLKKLRPMVRLEAPANASAPTTH